MAAVDLVPSESAPARRIMSMRTFEKALPWLVVFGLLVIWEACVRLFAVPVFILPAPTVVFESMWKWRTPLLDNSWRTLMTTGIGFTAAVVFGLFLGVLTGSSRLLYNGLYPALIGFNAIPKVAIVPILTIWFGIGVVPAAVTAFLISFFPVAANVAVGVATVEPELRDVLRALGASRIDIVRKVGLPRAMPYFFASLKVAITVAFVGSIIAETIASDKGIGHLMTVASSRFDTPLVFAGLMMTAIMGIGMYALADVVEKRMTGWAVRGMDGPGIVTG